MPYSGRGHSSLHVSLFISVKRTAMLIVMLTFDVYHLFLKEALAYPEKKNCKSQVKASTHFAG